MTKEQIWEFSKESVSFYCDETTPQDIITLPCDVCGNETDEFIRLFNNNCDDYYCVGENFYLCKNCFLKGDDHND